MQISRIKRLALLAAPVVVPLTTLLIYRATYNRDGADAPAPFGTVFYWIVWCLLFPLWVLGPRELLDVLRPVPEPWGRPRRLGALLLAIPVLMGLLGLFAGLLPEEVFGTLLDMVPRSVLLLAVGVILVSVWNGVLEEVLWRGTFIRVFPDNRVAGYLYPAVGFGLWHLGPALGVAAFHPAFLVIAGAGIVFGLCWGWVAWKTQSIFLAALSHVLSNMVLTGALLIALL